jgi:hypothetical protein
MVLKSTSVSIAAFALAVFAIAVPSAAQTVIFTDIRDAVPLKFFSAAGTHVDPGAPNTLLIGLESGRDSGDLRDDEFRASTGTSGNRNAMDTISFTVVAPAGHYVASITYEQVGSGSILRVADAHGASSWVVNGHPASLGFFRPNPTLTRTLTLTDPQLAVVPVSITTNLSAFAASSFGDAIMEITSAKVVVTLAPVTPGEVKENAVINVTGFTGAYDGLPHGATGTATGVNGENLSSLLNFGETFTDAPGGTAHWTFAGDTNYNAAAGTVAITIDRADAVVNVSGFTGTYDGAPHGATGTATGVNNEILNNLLDLGATFTNVPGGIANWTFSGGTNYNAVSGTAAIVINKATPVVSWPQPAPVVAGTVLGATQLNATANVDGTFVYSPPAGTVLTATQSLSVTFTPADTVNYNSATATVTITVEPNTGVQIVNPGAQTDRVGDDVRLRIRLAGGSPADRRSGVFTAIGLPPGLVIQDDGDIRGELTTEGIYLATVTCTINGVALSTQFQWTVLPRGGKGGRG